MGKRIAFRPRTWQNVGAGWVEARKERPRAMDLQRLIPLAGDAEAKLIERRPRVQ
jgi:hypothetical protein